MSLKRGQSNIPVPAHPDSTPPNRFDGKPVMFRALGQRSQREGTPKDEDRQLRSDARRVASEAGTPTPIFRTPPAQSFRFSAAANRPASLLPLFLDHLLDLAPKRRPHLRHPHECSAIRSAHFWHEATCFSTLRRSDSDGSWPQGHGKINSDVLIGELRHDTPHHELRSDFLVYGPSPIKELVIKGLLVSIRKRNDEADAGRGSTLAPRPFGRTC